MGFTLCIYRLRPGADDPKQCRMCVARSLAYTHIEIINKYSIQNISIINTPAAKLSLQTTNIEAMRRSKHRISKVQRVPTHVFPKAIFT